MNLRFVAGYKVAEIYGALETKEHYYCNFGNFGVNPNIVPLLEDGTLQIVGSDSEGAVRVLELLSHPFFIATLFVPQNRSRPDWPHALVASFLKAAVEFRASR